MTEKSSEAVEVALELYGPKREEVIPILIESQPELGYLPTEALETDQRILRIPQSQVFSVASFYQMLSTKKRGRHVVKFCESAPCHVVGGRQVWQRIETELKIKPGETSPDGKWTLRPLAAWAFAASDR